MMPVIRVSDAAFVGLKQIAAWHDDDTPSRAIDQLVRREMDRLGFAGEHEFDGSSDAGAAADAGPMTFTEAPGLSFTRVLAAKVGKRRLPKPKWSALLLAVVRHLHEQGITGERLSRELQVPSKAMRHEDNGYKFHPEIGLSIQGQSASDAWREVSRLATKHHIPVEVEFQWRANEKAQHPNQLGVLRAGL